MLGPQYKTPRDSIAGWGWRCSARPRDDRDLSGAAGAAGRFRQLRNFRAVVDDRDRGAVIVVVLDNFKDHAVACGVFGGTQNLLDIDFVFEFSPPAFANILDAPRAIHNGMVMVAEGLPPSCTSILIFAISMLLLKNAVGAG